MKIKKILPLLTLSAVIMGSGMFAMASGLVSTEATAGTTETAVSTDVAAESAAGIEHVHNHDLDVVSGPATKEVSNEELNKVVVDDTTKEENEEEQKQEEKEVISEILTENLVENQTDNNVTLTEEDIDEKNIDIDDFTVSYIGSKKVKCYYNPVEKMVVYEKVNHSDIENPFLIYVHIYKKEDNMTSWRTIKKNGEKGQDKNGHVYWEYTPMDDIEGAHGDHYIAYRDCYYHVMYNEKDDFKQIKIVRH